MNRIDAIIQNEIFRAVLHTLAEQEHDRIYCCHGLEHLLDVARVAYIRSLERGIAVRQDVLYAAALLHDIGRSEQYASGTPHEQAGVPLAQQILRDTSYTEEERQDILRCVRSHHCGEEEQTALQKLICEADKCSRPCYLCAASDTCKWSEQRKNLSLNI